MTKKCGNAGRVLEEELRSFGFSKLLCTFVRLITYFGNFVFGFLSLRLRNFFVGCFPFARQDGQDEIKNKQTITLSPKTTKNDVAKMG